MSIEYMMPLCNSSFKPGQAVSIIMAMEDEDKRKIAYGEYCYFSGKHQAAINAVERYLDSDDSAKMLSAAMICTFANIALGNIERAREIQEKIRKLNEKTIVDLTVRGGASFANVMSSTLLHIKIDERYPLCNNLKYLPEGVRGFALYLKAHEDYLKGHYEQAIGVIRASLAVQKERHPIPFIYMMMVMSMSYMSLKKVDEASDCFRKAWEVARPDDLIEPFGEHHGLLQGLIERELKKQYPEHYERIISITYSFSSGWRRIHNPATGNDVADILTTTEFTIAMMASKSWRNKEIADHLGMSPNTVKKYLDNIYQKLNITKGRKELIKYMLR